jgi:RHS repeat-associated protein
VVGTFTYDAYGKPTASTGVVSTPFGFAGQYTDAETGFVYLRARYYDPATGQFISRDPLTGTTGQPYSYADNNPLNATDPLGLFCLIGENPNGSCRGSGVAAALQAPIAALGTLANEAASIAQTVAAACAVTGQAECVALAESVALAIGALGTLAAAEVTLYACLQSPGSTTCATGAAVTLSSALATLVGARLGKGAVPTQMRAILADLNAAASAATERSRLLQSAPSGCL